MGARFPNSASCGIKQAEVSLNYKLTCRFFAIEGNVISSVSCNWFLFQLVDQVQGGRNRLESQFYVLSLHCLTKGLLSSVLILEGCFVFCHYVTLDVQLMTVSTPNIFKMHCTLETQAQPIL